MTQDTKPVNIGEIERLAGAATPGPWKTHGDNTIIRDFDNDSGYDLIISHVNYTDDTNFIAAANPETILSLVSLVRELHEALKPLANHADAWEGAHSHVMVLGTQFLVDANGGMAITVGDLRRAANACKLVEG